MGTAQKCGQNIIEITILYVKLQNITFQYLI